MEKQFPKNVRQIGNVSDEPRIYVEDYVDTFLAQMREKGMENPAGVVLVGRIMTQEGQGVVYISGGIQMKDISMKGTEIILDEEVMKQVEEDRAAYFPEEEIVGWCLVENGHPAGRMKEIQKIHRKLFDIVNTVFIWKDALEQEELFYAYKYGELMQMGGHYIYYEKNPEMQSYMISMRRQIGVTPSEMVEDRAAKDFRSAVRDKLVDKEQQQGSRMVYAMSILLVVVVLAIGISTMNNFDRMEAVQDSLESLSQAVSGGQTSETETVTEEPSVAANSSEVKEEAEGDASEEAEMTIPDASATEGLLSEDDYYVVQKGDTLDGISQKLYGDSSQVKAICKMNGLSDGNLIYIGQKLLLP